jgi:hypothetical protein
VPAEDLRGRIRAILAAAYGEGLLSPGTLTFRLDQLADGRVIDPGRLIGDLNLRAPDLRRQPLAWLRERLTGLRSWPALTGTPGAAVLALDWEGTTDEVLIGRHPGCDVVLAEATVSRRHAQLRFRDGHWILHDLGSTNGTAVNGQRVMRCQLRPGDLLRLGERRLVVD